MWEFISRNKIYPLVLLFFGAGIGALFADTINLKNGNSIDGIIKSENSKEVELDMGYGTVKFTRLEIERIYKSKPEESDEIQKQWEKEKEKAGWLKDKAEADRKRSLEEWKTKYAEMQAQVRTPAQAGANEVPFREENGQIILDVVLNKRMQAAFILDTGASTVLLTKAMVEQLGVKPSSEGASVATNADGRQVKQQQVMLGSVMVGNVEERDVQGSVILDDSGVFSKDVKSGLLGMSFLGRFKFEIDHQKKKLILSKVAVSEDKKR